MGLDMYLEAEAYVSDWTWQDSEIAQPEKAMYHAVCEYLGIEKLEDSPSGHVRANVGYWRKANAVHKWFVDNVQDGEDNCERHYVERDQLKQLKRDCLAALAAIKNGVVEEARQILTPTSGFFFGNDEVDDYYVEQLERTVVIVDRALALDDKVVLYYQSSW